MESYTIQYFANSISVGPSGIFELLDRVQGRYYIYLQSYIERIEKIIQFFIKA